MLWTINIFDLRSENWKGRIIEKGDGLTELIFSLVLDGDIHAFIFYFVLY